MNKGMEKTRKSFLKNMPVNKFSGKAGIKKSPFNNHIGYNQAKVINVYFKASRGLPSRHMSGSRTMGLSISSGEQKCEQ
jgi:hypothetical protein